MSEATKTVIFFIFPVPHSNLNSVMRQSAFCICKNKDVNHLPGYCTADQLLYFQYIYRTISLLPNPTFQASSHLLWLYSLVCVGPGRKP